MENINLVNFTKYYYIDKEKGKEVVRKYHEESTKNVVIVPYPSYPPFKNNEDIYKKYCKNSLMCLKPYSGPHK